MVSKARLSFFGHHAADFSYQVGQADFPLQYGIQVITPEQKEVFMPLARGNGIVRKSGMRNSQSQCSDKAAVQTAEQSVNYGRIGFFSEPLSFKEVFLAVQFK